MKTEFWVYNIYNKEMNEDWLHEIPGTLMEKEVLQNTVVVNDCSDNICIGCKDANGVYRQFDSYEAYYANDYFSQHPEWKIRVEGYKVSIDNIEQFKVKE